MTSTPVRPEAASVKLAVRAAIEQIGSGVYGVACSGGADSVALAHAATEVAGATRVVVLVIDHGLSPASAVVAAAVARWGEGLGAAALVERVTVPVRASVEAAARDARYAALERLAEQLGLVAILVGHTARDQAETVLMRILRGTGPAGLAGIPPVRGRFVRPLLELPRAATEAYVAAHQLPTWNDPMNTDHRLARVRVREAILPALRAENPQLDAALLRLAASAQEWTAAIDAVARRHLSVMACDQLAREPAAIRKRAVALMLERAGLGYEAAHLEQVDGLITAPADGEKTVDVPGGRVVRRYDALRVEVGPWATAASPMQAPEGPYHLRIWRPGDRMRPARLRGRSRKLSDLFIDAKVPRSQRALARVLIRTTNDGIVWAEFIGLAYGEPADLVPKPA
ncbi:MAG: tRNA lysidine(34) synthetase TilS [Kofleriaceae bacterium]|nr:tRNA lysidine(34) synthetase TilS [Kofleriaceae bacterium]